MSIRKGFGFFFYPFSWKLTYSQNLYLKKNEVIFKINVLLDLRLRKRVKPLSE